MNLDEQLAVKAKDSAAQDMRLALLMEESYNANLASHCRSASFDHQKKGKRQILADLLEEQKQALACKEAEAQEKGHRATECKRLVELKARMCEGVKVECDRLRHGIPPALTRCPWYTLRVHLERTNPLSRGL